jgi:para-nitrobenzyl esterase
MEVRAFIVALIGFAAPAMGADSAALVSVSGGRVRGATLDNGGAVFKGIPYAQAPIGDLRWREPMAVKTWSGVRDATAFGPICAQAPNPLVRNAAEISKEDCLFLNVWTPEWPTKSRRPVMVWIPGGGNFAGGSHQDDGERLARRGVVLVSFNFRLGAFGFFSHPELTRESSRKASGNQGILDQIAALKWVQANISKFGGDPQRVTVFGESSGSLDVSVLMTTPLSKGLFNAAIGQSGPVMLLGDPLTLPQAEKRGEQLAAGWNVRPGASLADMRAVAATDILKAEPDYLATPWPNLGITVDGYVFPKQPAAVFAAGRQHRIPMVLGNTARENVPFSAPPPDLSKAIDEAYGPLSQRARSLYAGPADPIYGSPVAQWRTDTSYRCTSIAQLVWHAAAGNPTFEYEFARTPAGREALGATHASDVSYVFGSLVDHGIGGVGPPVRAAAADVQLSETMQQYWINFARTGNPNAGNLPNWPAFDVRTRAYLQFTDLGPVAKQGLRRPFCDLFIENLDRLVAK